MSRNRYTKLIRKEQHAQFARQGKELVAIRRTLRRQDVESVAVSPRNEAKERHSVRLEQKRRHKPTRHAVVLDTAQKARPSVEVAA